MRWLSAVGAAALVAALGAGTAAQAFEGDAQPGVRIYFTIPFGPDKKAQSTPAVGLRIGLGTDSLPYGEDPRDYGNVQAFNSVQLTLPRSELDFRWRLDGKSSTKFNGLDVERMVNALYARSGEDIVPGYVIPLAVIGAGVAVFAGAKEFN